MRHALSDRRRGMLSGVSVFYGHLNQFGPRIMEFIDLKAQYALVQDDVNRRIQQVLSHGQYILGPEVAELEHKLAAYVGTTHCVAVASGTDALLLALMALGVKAGDEVITTPFSFIATAEVIALIGAKPIFIDIDPISHNIRADLIEQSITSRTRAIMPVSLYGQCADYDAINTIAARHGLAVIEDGAQSFGATYRGRKSCGLTTIGCTSFFPSKPLGGYGDSGACFTNDDELATKMRWIRVHGQDRRYHQAVLGVNGRIDTLQAAILLAKFDIFPAEVSARQRLGARYSELLAGIVATPHVEPHNTSVYAQYTVEVNHRAAVQESLKRQGVPTAVHYPITLNLQPVFSDIGLGVGAFPVAEAAAQRVMSLPMHPYLVEDDQRRVAQALAEAMKEEI